MKKEKGRNPVRPRLKSKLSLTSTIIEFRMLVIKEIEKKIIITKMIINMYLCFAIFRIALSKRM